MNAILDYLQTALATAFSASFSSCFKGRVKRPAVDNLPMLTIFPIETNQKHSGTKRDWAIYKIGVELHLNLRAYFDTTNGQGDQLDSMDAIVNFVEERNSDGSLKDATVMGTINNELTVNGLVLYTDNMQVVYGEPVQRENGLVVKVTITFEAHDRPNR